MIIGVIGLKYLFGDRRSLAGFIGFLFLGSVVFVLIKWGDDVLGSLGGTFRSWVTEDPMSFSAPQLVDYLVGVGTLALVLLGGGLVRAKRAAAELSNRKIDDVVESALMDRAEQVALDWLPNNPREAKRLVNQVRFTMLLMSSRGLLGKDSPVTPEHIAKWVLMNEKWPGEVVRIARNPEILSQWERDGPEMGNADSEQRRFMTSTPRLSPVVHELLHMLPSEAASEGDHD